MSKHDLSARLPTFGPSLVEAGYVSLIELGRLDSERMILADLYNDVGDFVRHRMISIFRKIGLFNIIELRYNTFDYGYAVFSGGLYHLANNILVVS
jgi:hypothetical protein